jgi:phosphoribosyl-ATP pyrophosphohydrolase
MADTGKYRLDVFAALEDTIVSRRGASPETSYTARLFAQGIEKCAKKLGEEAVEAAIAAVSGNRPHLTREAADVLYHLLVLLAAAEVPLSDVMTELERRSNTSGLDEKASRKGR